MKRFIVLLLVVCTAVSYSFSRGRLSDEQDSRSNQKVEPFRTNGTNPHNSIFSYHDEKSIFVIHAKKGDSSSAGNSLPKIDDFILNFSLALGNADTFSLPSNKEEIVAPQGDKKYFRPAWEITRLNFIVWAFDRYILRGSWTNISFESISDNLRSGLTWDYDDFGTNHFGHAYHGAMYHSIARAHGHSFFESSIYTLLGSLTWEFLWESELPGKNDSLLSTLGGMNLGEALFRIADLVTYENATGLRRTLGKSLKFLINPVCSLKESSENHFYSLRMPLGAYHSSDDMSALSFSTQLEYKDIFNKDSTKINPYDWFSFDMRLGINNTGIRDPEIRTTGLLFGKKYNQALAGIFGLFDYINTHVAEQISAVGFGPGFVTTSPPQADSYFNSTGVLSFVFGSSSASVDFYHPRFVKESNDPYHFGPGILGRLKFELGKKSLGSFQTSFSQYWVHSVIADANEFMSQYTLESHVTLRNLYVCLTDTGFMNSD